MGRKFKMNSRRKTIRAPVNTVYPKNPVGSNEWIREQSIRIEKRRIVEDEKKKKLRERL
tara:strand:+ start:891 stop:1067 length:177 start_codon:yes stop_codon:yes gene_type:complete